MPLKMALGFFFAGSPFRITRGNPSSLKLAFVNAIKLKKLKAKHFLIKKRRKITTNL